MTLAAYVEMLRQNRLLIAKLFCVPESLITGVDHARGTDRTATAVVSEHRVVSTECTECPAGECSDCPRRWVRFPRARA